MREILGPLLGPIYFIQDVDWENWTAGIAACVLLIPCLTIWLFRPRWWSVLVAILAAGVWLFLGAIGIGINC
jgi:hypothetical protein